MKLPDDLQLLFHDGITGFVRVFWYYCVFELPRLLFTDIVVVLRRWRERVTPPRDDSLPYSVVIPVLNEGDTIGLTVRSLEEQTRRPEKIILVDDGSTDSTPMVCRALEARSPRIRYLMQGERGGKSAALNRGLRVVSTEAVVFVDSDSTFDRDSMRRLLRRLDDPKVVAVGGLLRVRNRHANLLTEAQAIEYGFTIGLAREAKAELGILPIISGAFGAFRTRAVRAVGGHDPGPGNDSDLTIDLRKRGGHIAFAHDAVCYTNAPTRIRVLTKQRRRWCRNVIKNRLRKHANLFSPFRRGFRLRNLISTLDPIVYQVVFGWLWLAYLIDTCVHRSHMVGLIVVANWLLYLATATWQQSLVIACSEHPREDAQGLLYLPLYHLYRIYHRFVMLFAQLEELFTRTSLRDPFAPKKVQNMMPDW